MKIDIDFYKKAYFYFDKPVDYQIKDKLIKIYPVAVEDSEVFLSSMNILMVDKNSVLTLSHALKLSSDSCVIPNLSYINNLHDS